MLKTLESGVAVATPYCKPEKIFYVMRGLPGSGKTTVAHRMGETGGPHWDANFVVISTDNYWYRPDGTYDFNGRLLSQAHAWAFDKFKDSLCLGEPQRYDQVIVLDNTNIKKAHFAAYVAAARLAGYEVRYAYGTAPWAWDPEGCAQHNRHGVPVEVIRRMAAEYEAGEV